MILVFGQAFSKKLVTTPLLGVFDQAFSQKTCKHAVYRDFRSNLFTKGFVKLFLKTLVRLTGRFIRLDIRVRHKMSDVTLDIRNFVNRLCRFFSGSRDCSCNGPENGFVFIYVLGQPAGKLKRSNRRKYYFGFYTPLDNP